MALEEAASATAFSMSTGTRLTEATEVGTTEKTEVRTGEDFGAFLEVNHVKGPE